MGSFRPASAPGFDMNNQTTDLLNWGNLGVSGKWSRKWSDKLYSNMVFGYSNYYSTRDNFSKMTITRSDTIEERRFGMVEDNDLTDITFRADAEYLLGQNHKLEFGAELTNIQVDYNMILNDTINILDRQNSENIMAVYLQDKIKVADLLSFNVGLRTAYYDVTDKFYLEPRMQAQYHITDNLKVKVNQEEITASTIVPAKPPGAEISDNIIYMKQVESFFDMRGVEWPDPVVIIWDNPEQEYFFFMIDNLEEYPEFILPFMEEEGSSGRKFKFSMTTKPTQLDFYQIQPRSLTYFGQYMIKFFRVNKEYARLYETIEQDSRELNEPYTNINNGLGIFTAFACDSLYFEVKKWI